MKNKNMIGFTQEYYTLQNADGHDLAISQGINYFLTEDIAIDVAQEVCLQLKETVLLRKHTDEVVGAFQATVTVNRVDDTSRVAS